jgi:hypothetical protein
MIPGGFFFLFRLLISFHFTFFTIHAWSFCPYYTHLFFCLYRTTPTTQAIHVPSGIQTRNPSKRDAIDLCVIPKSHCGRRWLQKFFMRISLQMINCHQDYDSELLNKFLWLLRPLSTNRASYQTCIFLFGYGAAVLYFCHSYSWYIAGLPPFSSSEIRNAWSVHQCLQMTALSPFQHCSSYTILYQALLRDSRTQFWQRQMWNQLTWWAWSLTRRVCTRVLRGWMFEFRWGQCSCDGVYSSNYHHFISYSSID